MVLNCRTGTLLLKLDLISYLSTVSRKLAIMFQYLCNQTMALTREHAISRY